MAKKKVSKIFLSLLIVISILIIITGTYLLYLSKPKRIVLESLNNYTKDFNNIELLQVPYKDYTIKTDFNISATGKDSKEENEYSKIVNNIINNYNDTTGVITYTTNKTKKELYLDYSTKVKNKDLVSGKYFIENSTEYYHVNGITDTYINNGNNTYFESLDNSTNETENIIYLKNTTLKYFVNNIDDKYINTELNKKNNKIIIELDNNRLNKIYRKTIKDLKKNTRTRNILTSYNRDFFKNKKDIKFLSKNKKLIINVYTSYVTYIPNKYEFIYSNKKVICTKQAIKVYKNNKLKLLGKVNSNDKRLNISLLNSNYKKIGNINYNKSKNNKKLVFYINKKDIKTNLLIKTYKKENKKSIKQNININLNSKENNKDLYNIRININHLITKSIKIDEDVSNSELDSSLDKAKKEEIKKTYQNIMDKIIK